ncbi:Uma2 family endonuclease [Planktothricoides raciborskii GIHE-MW2]|uniref:Uma2 family endonuclease n=2 Tax=Planktothricoides raciborskii TaxID=132608 RepID=A0AAU8JGH5_9CYAN|nr:Uma2 family endonuclease [Planktothricoides raciborskii]
MKLMPVELTLEQQESQTVQTAEVHNVEVQNAEVQNAEDHNAESEEWTPTPPPTDLIFDDGEPLESNRHRIAMNALIEAVTLAYEGREDYFAGGNMFIYYSSKQARNRDFKGPDVFITLNVDGTKERQGWVVWEEEGRYPDVIIELMSPSTAAEDLGNKKKLYEQTFKTGHYFVYDPFAPESLQGWKLGENFRYEAIAPDDRGWLWCSSLGLWLGHWSGTILRETATWLRFYDEAGNLVKLSFELAQQEREIAQQEREIAQQEKDRADRAESDLQQEQLEKQQEKERADRAEAALAAEREQKQKLRDRLQALGIDPDQLV